MSPSPADSLQISETQFDSRVAQDLVAEMSSERQSRVPEFIPGGGSTVVASDFLPPHGVFLVATHGADALGCGGLRRLGPGVGEIKRLFVSRAARGRGVGRALLRALEDRARSFGYRTIRLDTDGREPAAVAMFRSQGYREIDDYNCNEYARYWFERRVA